MNAREICSQHDRQVHLAICNLVVKFQSTCSVYDVKHPTRRTILVKNSFIECTGNCESSLEVV